MNRRGFIGIIASVVAGTKKAFGLLPAAASSPTPCTENWHGQEVRFVTRDGHEIEPSPVLIVTAIDQFTNTMRVQGSIPPDCVGRTIVISHAGTGMMDLPYYHIPVNGAEYLGLKRS